MAEIDRYSPLSGRILTEEGGTINIADLIGGSDTGKKENINHFSPRTGRMIKEDGTVVNITESLKDLIQSGGITPEQIQNAIRRAEASALASEEAAKKTAELSEALHLIQEKVEGDRIEVEKIVQEIEGLEIVPIPDEDIQDLYEKERKKRNEQ